jgi:hypothetical protein
MTIILKKKKIYLLTPEIFGTTIPHLPLLLFHRDYLLKPPTHHMHFDFR